MADKQGPIDRRLEDWIGKPVSVNLVWGPSATDDALIGIQGRLDGVDPNGIILWYSPDNVVGKRGGKWVKAAATGMPERQGFFPWRRVELIDRVETEDPVPNYYPIAWEFPEPTEGDREEESDASG